MWGSLCDRKGPDELVEGTVLDGLGGLGERLWVDVCSKLKDDCLHRDSRITPDSALHTLSYILQI